MNNEENLFQNVIDQVDKLLLPNKHLHVKQQIPIIHSILQDLRDDNFEGVFKVIDPNFIISKVITHFLYVFTKDEAIIKEANGEIEFSDIDLNCEIDKIKKLKIQSKFITSEISILLKALKNILYTGNKIYNYVEENIIEDNNDEFINETSKKIKFTCRIIEFERDPEIHLPSGELNSMLTLNSKATKIYKFILKEINAYSSANEINANEFLRFINFNLFLTYDLETYQEDDSYLHKLKTFFIEEFFNNLISWDSHSTILYIQSVKLKYPEVYENYSQILLDAFDIDRSEIEKEGNLESPLKSNLVANSSMIFDEEETMGAAISPSETATASTLLLAELSRNPSPSSHEFIDRSNDSPLSFSPIGSFANEDSSFAGRSLISIFNNPAISNMETEVNPEELAVKVTGDLDMI